jgi:hypothetical protein
LEPYRNKKIRILSFLFLFVCSMEQLLAAIETTETEVTLRADDEGGVTIELRAGGWFWACHIPDSTAYDPPIEIEERQMEERLMIACTALLNTIIGLFELDNPAVS